MKDILTQACAKIATPETWTQHALARDIDDDDKPDNHPLHDIYWEGINGRDPQACKWCALGAVQAVTTDDSEFRKARRALDKSAKILFGTYSIAEVNDEQGHKAVLQCYDHAIRAAA